MMQLGNGLYAAQQYEDALPVKETELSTMRRLDAAEESILCAQNNLANTYHKLGRLDEAMRMRQDVYSRRLDLFGEENHDTINAANNYAASLRDLHLFEEARSLLRKVIPTAQRVLGEDNYLTLLLKKKFAQSLYRDDGATLDDLREAVTTLEDTDRIARRVFGGAHPIVVDIERSLKFSRATLFDRETQPSAQDK